MSSRREFIWAVLRQLSPQAVGALPAEHVDAIITEVEQGLQPDLDQGSGGFGSGAEMFVEHIVLAIHIGLALIHGRMMLRDHHNERQLTDRLRRIGDALDTKLELTDELVRKLMELDRS